MPLTAKGQKIMANMVREYGPEKGQRVFYASRNAGRITGVDPGSADGGFVYQRGGLVDHDQDPDLPPARDEVQLVPVLEHPYNAVIHDLLDRQRILNAMHPVDQALMRRELLRRYWLGGYLPRFWLGGYLG